MNEEVKHFESLYPDATRAKEIEKITSFVNEGNSCQLLSLPGVGRATVLRLLSFNHNVRVKHFGEKQENIHFVLVDFSELRGRPLVDATKLVLLNLVDSLRERGKEDECKVVNQYFSESLTHSDELVLFQGLKKAIDYLANEKNLTIVYLFDRFEEFVPSVTQQFFANLRILRSHAKFHFSVVFSLPRPLDELIDPTIFADFYEYVAGHTVWMQLSDEPGMLFRKEYLEQMTGNKVADDLYRHILEVTSGHSKLTKLSLEMITASRGQRLASGEEVIEFLLKMRTIRGSLYEIWYSLRPEEQNVILSSSLVTLSKAKSLKDPSVSPQDDNKRGAYLEYGGLLKDGRIQIPLLAQFIQQEKAQLHTHKPLLYDEQTNTIKRGEQVFSDLLTASEFKLLKLLLTQVGQVVDREQIVEAVWGEMKSTAGVTEQAVDQLIFRLRKKVEEDPNQPRHIVTVKGRGIQFVQ